MKLKRLIEKDAYDGLDPLYQALYEEKDGKFHFVGVPLSDNEKALTTARDEAARFRTENVTLRGQMEAFKGLDASKVATELAELEALRAEKEAGDGKNNAKF